jgi:hypothetical protein
MTSASTLQAFVVPTVLVIGCPPVLVARCSQALEGMGVGLRACDFLNCATAVAERRPLAMVLLEDLYAFDPEELVALARDVQASLVRIEEDIPVAKLRLLLSTAVDAAAAHRGELLPAWEDAEAGPVSEPGARQTRGLAPRTSPPASASRRTAPNPALVAYSIGQRLPSRADVAAVAWPASMGGSLGWAEPPPSSRPGT